MDVSFDTLAGVALGIGLAAAAGFRVFVPLLVAGLAARYGHLPLSEHFAWLATGPALVMLGTAAVAEILAYYVPGIDHLLDVLAGPAALISGVVASAAVMTHLPPGILWPVAIIAGGGIAGITKGGAALLRAKSGLVTGGLANPAVSTVETVGATGLSLIAIALPLLALGLAIALLWWTVRRVRRFFHARRPTADRPQS
jgi:hypothetical protein